MSDGNLYKSLRVGVLGMLALVGQGSLSAAVLKSETAHAWDEYVRASNEHMQQRMTDGSPFLWIDEVPERSVRVHNREIVASPVGPHIPKKVPAGLIHDWVGATFIPGATIKDALTVVRNYERYKEFYHPNVIDSKMVSSGEVEDRFATVLMNKALFEKIALDSEYQATYTRLDDHKLYGISRTTRIREIAGYGTPTQHTLPEDQGTGLIWRLYSTVRFEERDGGLYMEIEAMVLSRDVPVALRVFVDPVIRRVSRDALVTGLHQTEEALHLAVEARLKHPQMPVPVHVAAGVANSLR